MVGCPKCGKDVAQLFAVRGVKTRHYLCQDCKDKLKGHDLNADM